MRYLLTYFVTAFLLINLMQCDLINPDEKIPAYIHIDSFTLSGDYDTVGSLSHKITDAWIMVDNEFIGAFELPCTFPVLKSGAQHVIIRAGIHENGISGTRLPYPFYKIFSDTLTFTEKKIDTINPTVQYFTSGIKYEFCDDFESSKSFFRKSSMSQVDFRRTDTTGGVFEGKYSMKATMDTLNTFFQMETYAYYNIPRNKAAFLELNYKSDITFIIGYIAYNPNTGDQNQHVVLSLNPAATWKKIYVNFGAETNFEPSYFIFKVFIGALKSDTSLVSTVFLDNVKLICYE